MRGTARWAALGGVVGPVAFVTAWSVLGTGRDGYSPLHDPISRLAAEGADTRAAMTAGFVTFGIGVGMYGPALRRALPGGAGPAALATAVATLGVAALPLDGGFDVGHAAAAGTAYAALAATPLLGALALRKSGRSGAAVASLAVGVLCGGALVMSAVADRYTGLFQRVGLTTGDVWIVTTALWLAARRPQR